MLFYRRCLYSVVLLLAATVAAVSAAVVTFAAGSVNRSTRRNMKDTMI